MRANQGRLCSSRGREGCASTPLPWLKAMRFPARITPQKMAASLGGVCAGL